MSSRIARAIIRMTVAAAIAPFSVGEIGGAVAQPSARVAALECLTNRSESPVSETDVRHAGRRERRMGDIGLGVGRLDDARAGAARRRAAVDHAIARRLGLQKISRARIAGRCAAALPHAVTCRVRRGRNGCGLVG